MQHIALSLRPSRWPKPSALQKPSTFLLPDVKVSIEAREGAVCLYALVCDKYCIMSTKAGDHR